MALHRLNRVVVGVPNVAQTAAYYEEFGLARVSAPRPGQPVRLATQDGGEQLHLVDASRRHVTELVVGVDDPDDLARALSGLQQQGFAAERTPAGVTAVEPGTGMAVSLEIAPRLAQPAGPPVGYNVPGAIVRENQRTDGVLRTSRVRPRKLGHVVIGSTDHATSQRFFVDGLGFKVSDSVKGRAAFLRCSTDHHNVLIQNTPAQFLHHTSWQVDDVDEVGRGATAMLEADPRRHVWGLGRHHIGSNFFWYLRDPAGNFSEYYSDLDCIVDDQLWTPNLWEGKLGLYSWGPPPPPSFLKPDDLAALMAGAHSPAGGGTR